MSYRASASSNTGAGTSLTLAVTVPAAAQVGDVLLVAVTTPAIAINSIASSNGSALAAVVAPTSFGSVSTIAVWKLTVAPGDPGSTITATFNSATRAAMLAWVETLVAAAGDGSAVGNGGSSVVVAIPTITPGAGNNNDRSIVIYGGTDSVANAGGTTLGAPSGWTQRVAVTTTHATLKNVAIAAAGRVLTSGAATGVLNASASHSVQAFGVSLLFVPSDVPPTANAGPDQSVDPGATVALTGNGSSDAEGAVSYAWSQTAGAAVTLSSSTAAQPTLTAPADVDGQTLTFRLTVTDSGGQIATDDVTVTVAPAPYMYRKESGSWVRRKLYRRVAGAWLWP